MDSQFDQIHHTVSTTPISIPAMASDPNVSTSSNGCALDSLNQLGPALPDLTESSTSPAASGSMSTVSATATSTGFTRAQDRESEDVDRTNSTTATHTVTMTMNPESSMDTTAMSNENAATVSATGKEKPSEKMSLASDSSITRAKSLPRYAQPTLASMRREAATLRALSENAARVNRFPPKWTREPTRPKSPNLRLAARMKMHPGGRASLPPNALNGSGNTDDQQLRALVRRKTGPTVPKSPIFRSKGPSRRYSVESGSPRPFVPTPLPSFLREQNNLPSIKLNIKTRAAMEARINPQARRSAVPPPSTTVRISIEPTVPKPFELGSLEQHEHYRQNLKAREALLEDEARRKRNFVANKVNPAILNGPTFVPARSSVPLTKPVDLLPFASERSQRTLEYERRQKERIAEKERDEEIARRMREEEEELKIKLEMMKYAFKPNPVPKSHYVPHTISSRSSSERSGIAAFALSASSEARPAGNARTSTVQEETSRPVDDPVVALSSEETNDTIEPTICGQETTPEKDSKTITSATHSTSDVDEQTRDSSFGEVQRTQDIEEEPSTPDPSDESEVVATPKGEKDNESETSKTSRTESAGSGSTWFMQRMRKSLSPILGSSGV